MPLNKSKGHMYGFINATFNMVKGKCPYGCTYCYMDQAKLNPVRFDETEIKTDLGEGNYIFVGSSCDMWATDIPDEWIEKVLCHCIRHPKNKYLFQTKNPFRFHNYIKELKILDAVLCTTIESNKYYKSIAGDAPLIYSRMINIKELKEHGFKIMVTAEPIMDFDPGKFYAILNHIRPDFLNIGADSKEHKLPEPSKKKLLEFISALKEADLNILEEKKNLKRILANV